MKHAAVLSFVLIAACSEQSSAPPKPTVPAPTTPTPPVARPGPLVNVLVVSSPVVQESDATSSVVYVSLPPNTVGLLDRVVITNPRIGATVVAGVIGTGFDPVAIPAVAGDVIDVAMSLQPYALVIENRITVTAGRPLRVIRTDPKDGSADVEADTPVRLVFSEPIDAARSAGRVRLQRDGQEVAASVLRDSTGTQLIVRPLANLSPATGYTVTVDGGMTGVTGGSLTSRDSTSFTTVPLGDVAAATQVTGTWDATSWRFANVDDPSGAIWDDPVVGWDRGTYYSMHVVIGRAAAAPPGTVAWRLEIIFHVDGVARPDSSSISGVATVGTGWLVGRTTASPYIDETPMCAFGFVCPFQSLFDFTRDGDVLTLRRRATLWYNDYLFPPWRANETLTLSRTSP